MVRLANPQLTGITMIAAKFKNAASIEKELDDQRDRGNLKKIVIPPCPELLSRLQIELKRPDPDLIEVSRIASSDVAMSATLLRTANSPLYLAGQPARTIGQAMNRLGLEQAAAVMVGFLAQQAIPVSSPHLQRFWQRASKLATAMAFVASKLPGMSPDLAHTYGLFCDVGMPVMMRCLPGYEGTMVEARARIDRSFTATENANHRTDHAVVGALVARIWGLAPEVTAAVRLHHDWTIIGHDATEPEIQTLVAAGLVADHLARHHEGLSPDADWKAHSEAALKWLGVTLDDLAGWEEEIQQVLDAV